MSKRFRNAYQLYNVTRGGSSIGAAPSDAGHTEKNKFTSLKDNQNTVYKMHNPNPYMQPHPQDSQ